MDLLLRLKKRIADGAGSLPITVNEWLIWTVEWLAEDDSARASLLYDVKRAILGACGSQKDGELTAEGIEADFAGFACLDRASLLPQSRRSLAAIRTRTHSQAVCPRARDSSAA